MTEEKKLEKETAENLEQEKESLEKQKQELEETNQKLQEELLEQKLKGINARILAFNDTIQLRLSDSEKANQLQFTHINQKMDEVLEVAKNTYEQTKLTNGRVTEIEKNEIETKNKIDHVRADLDKTTKHTKVVRFFHQYPVTTILFVLMFYLFSIKEIRDHTIEAVKQFFSLIGNFL